ncbi:hypothetical protein CEXT_687311 [Caerostris extrusa]|uniref:Uncharacterized protein n=1 Tax=Caerostris extrusa TaxID=172846 RepID=A0AAV4V6A1_CAEEX|nr:hypothetical protein CEXT_687311 [Caerostris extrusa]
MYRELSGGSEGIGNLLQQADAIETIQMKGRNMSKGRGECLGRDTYTGVSPALMLSQEGCQCQFIGFSPLTKHWKGLHFENRDMRSH